MPFTPKDSSYTDSFMFQNPSNSGIGNFFGDMDRWRDMSTNQRLTPDEIALIKSNNENGVDLSKAWMDNGNLQGAENQKLYDSMKSYLYRGKDGNNYMVGGNYYHGGGGDQEGANTAGDLAFGGIGALGHADQGRRLGEMAYSTTEFRPGWGGDMGDYNGKNFDIYDNKGKFVGGQAPMALGDDANTRQAIMSALMVLGPMAGVAAGAGFAGMNPVLAAEGLGAAGLGSAGTIGLGGVAGVGTGAAAGVGGGSGAFLGEGVQSGVPLWDGAAGGAAGGYGTTPLVGVGAPTAPGIGAPATGGVGGAAGGTGGGSGGVTGMLNQPLFEVPGLGGVSGQNLLGLGSTLLGGMSGGQGQSSTTTSTKDLPDYLQGPVGGLVGQANWLMGQQMNGNGLLETPAQKRKKKAKEKHGLL